MSRRYLITCRDSGAFFSGIFSFVMDSREAELFPSLRAAYRAVRESPALGGGGFWVEPADWYFPYNVLSSPGECDEDPESCDCSFHENVRAAEASHFDADPSDMQQRILKSEADEEVDYE